MYTQIQRSNDKKMFNKSLGLIILALALVLANGGAYAWNGTFSGNIGTPLAGVRVYCSGTGTTTTTNSSGAWSFTKTNIGTFDTWTPGLATILGPIPEGYSFRPMGFWSGTLTNLNTSSTGNNSTYTQIAGVRLGEFSGGASGDSLSNWDGPSDPAQGVPVTYPVSGTFTITAHLNPVLVVCIQDADGTSSDRPVSSVTWNVSGQPSQSLSVVRTADSDAGRSEIWYVKEPTVGTGTFSVLYNARPQYNRLDAFVLYDAMQATTPYSSGTFGTVCSVGGTSTCSIDANDCPAGTFVIGANGGPTNPSNGGAYATGGGTFSGNFGSSPGRNHAACIGLYYDKSGQPGFSVYNNSTATIFYSAMTAVAIQHQPNRAPDLTLGNNSVRDIDPANTVVGSLSVYNPDVNDTVSLSITDGGTFFNLNGLDLRINAVMPYGTYSVTILATDSRGATGEKTFAIYVTDTQKPVGTMVINSDAAYANSANVTLNLSCTDVGSGVAQMRFSEDNITWGDWETYATSKAWILPSDNTTHTVYAQFNDHSGNPSDVVSDSIILDTIAPYVVSISNPSALITAAGPISYTVTFSENVTGFDSAGDVFVNQGGSAAVGTVTVTQPDPLDAKVYTVTMSVIQGNGSLGIKVNADAAADAAGNRNPASGDSLMFTVDNTKPLVETIGAPSVAATKTGPVLYTVIFNEPVSGFTDGATDIQVNASPGVTLGTVSITAVDLQEYSVTLNGLSGNGTVGITVKTDAAKDMALNGNVISDASATFFVDNTIPEVTVPANYTTSTQTPTLQGVITDNLSGITMVKVHITDTLDPGVYAFIFDAIVTPANGTDCTWDFTVPGSNPLNGADPRDYTVEVIGFDQAGNMDSASFTLTKDTRVPDVTVDTIITNDTTPDITGTATCYSGLTISTVKVVVHGKTYWDNAPVLTSPLHYTWTVTVPAGDALIEDNYQVTATATSSPNNLQGSGTNTLWVDLTDPVINYTNIADKSANVLVEGTVTEAVGMGTVTVIINSTDYPATVTSTGGSSYTWTVDLGNFAEGRYTVLVTAVDAATNNAVETYPNGLIVDRTPPTGTLAIEDGAAYTRDTLVDLGLIVDDGLLSGVAKMRFSNDNVSWDAWSLAPDFAATYAGWALTSSQGLKTVYAQLLDAAGNESTVEISDTITLDQIAPKVTSISAPVPNPANTGPVTYTVTFDEAVTTFNSGDDVQITSTDTAAGATAITPTADPAVYTVTLSGITGNGTLSILVKANAATDLAGNPNEESSVSGVVDVDNITPTISIDPSSATLTRSGPVTYAVTYGGADTITLAKEDVSLNKVGTMEATITVEGTGNTRTVTLSGITGDGTLGISIAENTAADSAGNKAPAAGPSGTFTVDNTPPAIEISAPSEEYTQIGPMTYTITYTGADTITLTSNDIAVNKTGTANGTAELSSSGGNYTVTLSGLTGDGTLSLSIAQHTASDLAGNLAAAVGPGPIVTVDQIEPTFTDIAANPSKAVKDDEVTLTFNASEPLAGQPEVTVNDHEATYTSGKANAYTYTYTVSAEDPVGMATIRILGTDLAGNIGEAVDNSALEIAKGVPVTFWPALIAVPLAGVLALHRRRNRK